MEAYFEFEKPIVTLEKKLQDLRELSSHDGVDLGEEITIIEKKLAQLVQKTFSNLTPWQRVQISRHPNRPYTLDYIERLFPDFMELSGDRCFSEDKAIVGGIAKWPGTESSFLLLGHQKGRNTKQKMARNFGMAKPEGYRKAMRLMELADRTKLPILTFIDTPGAYPGLEAEERGQSQAIAESIRLMFRVSTPIVSVVLGEGGSGGALAIGVGNKVLMQEFSTYSVISPESCASILWSDSTLAERASEKLKMSPMELKELGVIDSIIPEPQGGAHRNWDAAASLLGTALEEHFLPFLQDSPSKKKGASTKSDSRANRYDKFRAIGEHALIKDATPSKSNGTTK